MHLPKTYGLVLSPDMLNSGVKKFIDKLPIIRPALSTSTNAEAEIAFKIFRVLCSAKTQQARSNVIGKKVIVAKDLIPRPIKRTIKQEEGLDGCMPSKRPVVSGIEDLLSSDFSERWLEQEAVVATSENTLLVARNSGPGSDSAKEDLVLDSNNNTSFVASVLALDGADAPLVAGTMALMTAIDLGQEAASIVAPKTDLEVPNTGDIDSTRTEKGEAKSVTVESSDVGTEPKEERKKSTTETVTIDDDSEAWQELVSDFFVLCVCVCAVHC
jgi:hypothetical protein